MPGKWTTLVTFSRKSLWLNMANIMSHLEMELEVEKAWKSAPICQNTSWLFLVNNLRYWCISLQFLCISAAQFAWQSAQKPLKLFKLSKGKQTSIFCNGNVFCQIVLGPKAMKMYFFALFGRCFTCCNWWKCDRNAFAKTHFWQKTCYGHGIHTRCGSTALQDVSIFSRILLLWWKNPTRLCTTANDRSFVLICDTGGK